MEWSGSVIRRLRRTSRTSRVRGKPNLIWVAAAGDLALVSGNTVWDAILLPGDWSGTVTEQSCTLERIVVTCMTNTITAEGTDHCQNGLIFLGNANEQGGTSTADISNFNDWPTFAADYDRWLHLFRLEWAGAVRTATFHPVQYSQLPDPVMNIKCRRRLNGDDVVRLGVGGFFPVATTEVHTVSWFARSLVRIGLK